MLPWTLALLRDIAPFLGPPACHHIQSLGLGIHEQCSCCSQTFAARSIRCNNYGCKLLLSLFFFYYAVVLLNKKKNHWVVDMPRV